MVLDIIATNNWERPIYFGIGMGSDNYMGLEKYFQLEGAAYRLVPIETNNKEYYSFGRIDTDILYDNVMNKFEWGNIKNPKVNIDHFHDNTIAVMRYRNTFLRLAEALIAEGKNDKAVAVLDKSLEELPTSQVPIDNNILNYIPLYYALGETEKADNLARELAVKNYQMLRYIHSLSPSDAQSGELQQEQRMNLEVIRYLIAYTRNAGRHELAKSIQNQVENLYNPTSISSNCIFLCSMSKIPPQRVTTRFKLF